MNTYTLKKENWKIESNNCNIIINNEQITINNTSNEKSTISYKNIVTISQKEVKQLKINFYGEYSNAGAFMIINNLISVPFNSTVLVDVTVPTYLNIRIEIPAESSITFSNIKIELVENQQSLIEDVSKEPEVLIITPNYPSLENLYYCAFAHSRVKEYLNNGIKVQVISVNIGNWYQTIYEHEGVPVIRGTYGDLKTLLARKQYKVILTHFVDEFIFPIFDGYIDNEKLLFICHGPETVYRYLVNVTRPYFTKPMEYPTQNKTMDEKDYWVKKYSQLDNVEWIFVSEWLKDFSESELKIKFKHFRVINNIINEELFPYHEKNEDDRKKILIIRKFDNIIQHSLDQVVLAILELSRRPFFNELSFEIYGDGNFYDTLVEPIKNFENVHLHRNFIPNNKISEIHKNSGIMLLPSRHDAHAVAMGEAASSGLVVVGSNVTSNPFFMNEKENHTLADPEDFVGLANIIEFLYKNPKEFLAISKRLSEETRTNYCKKNTVMKEVALIKESLANYSKNIPVIKEPPSKKPILTIAIPAYNVEKYINKCLNSILKTSNVRDIEILVINDGSTDHTSEIVQEYEKSTNGIVKLINKENGGHGSTINVSIEKAKGKYYRLIDGDDWVDSQNLSKLIDILKKSTADVVLTKGSYEYADKAKLEDIIKYDNLIEGHLYYFDDLVYKGFGFNTYGPLLTTGNYKTEVLKKANFKISEKKPYVDMEFNSFSLKNVETLEYYELDIYRYLIGRAGQTISRDYWKKKYKDHLFVIFNILEKTYSSNEYSKCKRKYILQNIIAQMVDSQIFMFDCLCLWKEIDIFLERLQKYPDAYEASINYITQKDGNCRLILEKYKDVIRKKSNKPIIIPGVRETVADLENYPILSINLFSKRNIKRTIKFITPYGLVKWHRRRHS